MNILTIDIEDWFHILDNPSTRSEANWVGYESRLEENLDRLLELLEIRKIKATFFCLGWIAEKYPRLIKKVSNSGYEIGCHSYMHQLVYEQSVNEFENDLLRGMGIIQDITGKRTELYRAPGFSITEKTKWAFEILIRNGIKIDSSIFAAHRGHGGFPEININEPAIIEIQGVRVKEFPISYYKVGGEKILFSGGGYFRLLPYGLIKRLTARSSYLMTYFHPRDFDPEQPVIKDLPLKRKFKSYYGLNGSFTKLNKWLDEFQFCDIADADRCTDWKTAPVIRI